MIDYGDEAAHAAAEAEKRARAESTATKAAMAVWLESLAGRRDGAADGRRLMCRTDPDAPFARPELSDTALTAAVWATRRFDSDFPGWQLYRRIMVGYEAFDAELLEWATGCAWALARAKTRAGRDYLRADARGPWIAFAAADALHCAIFGRYPSGADCRGYIHGVFLRTYRKVRDPVAGGLIVGLESFRSELHYQYHRAAKVQIDENGAYSGTNMTKVQTVHAGDAHAFRLFGDGNAVTLHEPVHD